ncbi:LutC/YkgG family protein [Nocardioides nanhaiensis]|uniref:LUD domain-containing protein n=1 Tax=Nocardioides nanhaiensis TaxID=1476871 RepID=A0ABP8X3G4_9ACTN
MSSAREEILRRVRTALDDRPEVPEVPWTYGQPVSTGDLDPVARFAERVADYRAAVTLTTVGDVAAHVAEALAAAGARRVVVPEGLPAQWRPTGEGIELVADDGLGAEDLDAVDAVLTGATLGIANTGTIVLDHGADQGRRALTLVPDVHVCVVRADQVVTDVPEAVGRLQQQGAHTRPLTWVSGPSATSDIELDRVEGVHGPRTLQVVIVEG